MKNKFDLIVFDWDGTLIDSIDWIVSCIQQAAQQTHCPVPSAADAKNVIGLSLNKAVTQLFPDVDQVTAGQLVSNYSELFFSRKIDGNDLFDGVFEMLDHLRQTGYQLAVATGKTRTGLDFALKATGTEKLFVSTRCADETASKPDPVMLQEIVEQVKVSKNRTLMIGDSIHDLQMAANADIASVAVSCGVHSPEILRQFKPLYCLNKTTEILKLL